MRCDLEFRLMTILVVSRNFELRVLLSRLNRERRDLHFFLLFYIRMHLESKLEINAFLTEPSLI